MGMQLYRCKYYQTGVGGSRGLKPNIRDVVCDFSYSRWRERVREKDSEWGRE